MQSSSALWIFLAIAALFTSPTAAQSPQIQTWIHENAALTEGPIQDAQVRGSTWYSVSVAPFTNGTAFQPSFVYMSIPRNGEGKKGYTKQDGAELATDARLTFSWSSFLFSSDVWVEVKLLQSEGVSSANDVVIRPSKLGFNKQLVDRNTVRILVPYSETGHRFSVEFANQDVSYFNDLQGDSGNPNTQGVGAFVAKEPRNALMIFADSMEFAARTVPAGKDIFQVPQGEFKNVANITNEVVFFGPGLYFMPSNYHAQFGSSVKHVYLAPGAYLKGAFEFTDSTNSFQVTGLGVLSGEKYVYEPDTRFDYNSRPETVSDCHGDCVKMLRFGSGPAQQTLRLHGITVANPPYHSFVVYGANGGTEDTFSLDVDSYKQVGSWFWQTDGIECYRGSSIKHTFFHANDDGIKIYHPNVVVEDVTMWHGENGPIVQWGWVPREISNVTVDGLFVMHDRTWWKDEKHNTCILNSAKHWDPAMGDTTADTTKTIRDIRFLNIQVEGRVSCAIRINAQSNHENILIQNFSVEA
ncbi:hypothetical protein HK102_005880, partial [Quaeritorhiza haematococci]